MEKRKISEIVLSVCILIIGICLTIWAEKVTTLVSILLGCLAILYGIMVVINYFRNKERLFRDTIELVYGIIVLVIGFVLVFKVDFLKELVSLIIGIYIVITSVLKLSENIKISKELNTKISSLIILPIIEIFIGLLCILGKFLLPDIIVKFIGIMLIIYSIITMIDVILLKRK